MNQQFLCVYSSSSICLPSYHYEVSKQLAHQMAQKGYGLVFGGGTIGVMGVMAQTMTELSAPVIGVIPKALHIKGVVYERCSRLIVTETMRERKAIMEELAAGFIAVSGGFGTLEELMEIIVLKQLDYHNKPIVILNYHGFYDSLLKQFELFYEQGFAHTDTRSLYYVAKTPAEVWDYIAEYKPLKIRKKWLEQEEAGL
ncbi:MAG: LOG family protein [Christensenellales bacterium]